MRQQVFQYGGRTGQHVIVPVPDCLEALGAQDFISRNITQRLGMLASIYFHDHATFETDEVE
jgi:hypothetical protein